MKKLIFVLPGIDVGGAQRFCLNFCNYLNSINYSYKVIFLRRAKSIELKSEFVKNNIDFLELNYKKVFFSFFGLIKTLRKEKPDVLMSSVGNVDFLCSIIKLFFPKLKFIIRKATVVYDNQISFISKLKLRFESIVCDYVISLTERMKQDYINYGFDFDKIFVINNMVDLSYIDSKLKEKTTYFMNFKRKNKKVIITSARFVPEKRFDILIKAFYELRKKRDDIVLLLLGDGPLLNDIKSNVSKEYSSDIIFLGFQNNPYYYMKNSDVFVLSSDYEGFPNVIIEAFACGLPVVSTDAKTGPNEIIIDNYNGFVVPRGNYVKIADKIDYILSSPKYEKFKNNSFNSSKKYDVELISKKYLNIIESEK